MKLKKIFKSISTNRYWLEIWINGKMIKKLSKTLTQKQYEQREKRIKYKGLCRFHIENYAEGYLYK